MKQAVQELIENTSKR